MTNIDLHIHSSCSDGALSPFQIIDEANRNNIQVISITDHDTLDAYTDELFKYANEKNIELITGIEISTQLNNVGFHVLGYNMDIHNEKLLLTLDTLKKERHTYLSHVSQKLIDLGYVINQNDLSQIEIVTKAHIARNILNNSLNNNLLLKQFKHLPNMGEFIETMLNEGCPAYVMKNTITPKQASDCIKNAKGKVILAHPVCYKYEDQIDKEDIQKLVLDMNADGIEAGYIYIDRYLNKIDEIDQWKQFANDHHLSITIGSDFHRFDEIHPTIGLINEHIEIDTNAILQNFKENIK